MENVHRIRLRLVRGIIGTIIIVIIGIVLYLSLYHFIYRPRPSLLVRTENKEKKLHASEEKTIVSGLRYKKFSEDKKILELKIDSIKVFRNKVGFYRLGFWKIARMENVRIDLYQQHEGRLSTIDTKYKLDLIDFEKLFLNQNNLSYLSLSGVKGIEICNIKINVYRNAKIISSVFSDEAKINLDNKRVLFEGNVRIATGENKLLECSKIYWILDTKKFSTRGRYIAKVRDTIIEGKDLETDFLLENL